MRVVSALLVLALLAVATVGLSGEGAIWTRYVGAGTLFLMLLLILIQISGLANLSDLRKLVAGIEPKPPAVLDDDDGGTVRARRTSRN